MHLSKQAKLKDSPQISFIGRLCRAAMCFIIEKSEETTFECSQNSANIKMETQKIVNMLNSSENEYSEFATKKLYIIDCESKGVYSKDNSLKFLTKSVESSICNYSDAYILVAGDIAVKRR